MKTTALFTGLAVLGLAACDSSVSTGASTSTTGSGGDASTSATGATTGAGGSDPNSVTITLDSFDVPPGAEVYKCQNFSNPFGGIAEVRAFESHMSAGSHHLLLFYKNGVSDGPLEDCSGLEFAPTPYSTQLKDDTVAFPTGVAAEIPAAQGLRVQSHYLNVTGQTITAHVEITFHLADPATVTDHAGVMFIVQPDIQVAPNSTQVVSYDCNVPTDMHVMKAASHMHSHGSKFTSTVAGVPFYDTTTWDEPAPTVFDPTMDLKSGDPLHFECTFVNDTSSTLTFGESAKTNEMCILVASYYPALAGFPTIDCH
jgi:hypothetical protein